MQSERERGLLFVFLSILRRIMWLLAVRVISWHLRERGLFGNYARGERRSIILRKRVRVGLRVFVCVCASARCLSSFGRSVIVHWPVGVAGCFVLTPTVILCSDGFIAASPAIYIIYRATMMSVWRGIVPLVQQRLAVCRPPLGARAARLPSSLPVGRASCDAAPFVERLPAVAALPARVAAARPLSACVLTFIYC